MMSTLNQDISAPTPALSQSTHNDSPNNEEFQRAEQQQQQTLLTDTSNEMSLCSGLSALIQAATSQLGHPINYDDHVDEGVSEGATNQKRDSPSSSVEDFNGSFPELLMTLLLDPQNIDTIAFLPDGTYFAIRTKEFSQGLMRRELPTLMTFKDFLALAQQWGFTRICANSSMDDTSSGEEESIQVFRHPNFNRYKVGKLYEMRFGQNPTETRMSAIPEKVSRIQLSASTSPSNLSSEAFPSKRRLSPSHRQRATEDSTQKSQRVYEGETNEVGSIPRTLSSENDSETSGRRRSSRDIRSYVSTELEIQSQESEDGLDGSPPKAVSTVVAKSSKTGSATLVQGGVERATHNIVTDAIETLLFDECHTRETYLKHERELSKSVLPGIVPISKQLFSRSEGVANGIATVEHNGIRTNGHREGNILDENRRNAK
jgi:hypothetical protein